MTNLSRRKNATDVVSDVIHEVADSSKALTSEVVQTLMSWHEIEDWQRDNEFILTGYRR